LYRHFAGKGDDSIGSIDLWHINLPANVALLYGHGWLECRHGEVLRAMGKDADRVNAFFISVDPERDTEAAMKDYLSSFDPHLKGLTGSPEAVAKVISDYRAYARKVPTKDGDYTMDHTALIYLMDRNGKFVSPFNLKRSPEEAAKDQKRYL